MPHLVTPPPVHPPIGVFDSGIGGLSVLQALQAELPHERFVYVADSGHAPYGERNDDYVLARSHAITGYLQQTHGIKALVVACNTATAAAIHVLRENSPTLPIVGVEPALKPATEYTRTGVVGVMATRGTLASEKFRTLLERMHGKAEFHLQPCDGLADAIECDDTARIDALCALYTHAMGTYGAGSGAMDTLVLGCTHYPFVSEVLRRNVGPDVQFLEAGVPVARQTRRVLEMGGMLVQQADAVAPAPHTGPAGRLQMYTSGNVSTLQAAVKRWLGQTTEAHPLNG